MKSKRSLMTVLIGLAMLATPITAAARDNNRHAQNNSRAVHVSGFSHAPGSFASSRNFAPTGVPRHEFRNQRGGSMWGNANDYRNYGNGGYYGRAYPATNSYYGAPGYAGGSSCARAQRIMNVYQRDRYTGHPAAAAELLRQNRWALSGGCGGVSPTGGLFNGFSGASAYNNYGGNNGGYGQPYGNYGGGYGQPYGATSMLAPLLQQFVH